jgi:hypothetical protein
MSRSYKKPVITDQQRNNKSSKWAKRQANKAVRKESQVADGKSYRKVSDSWKIRDWSFYSTDPKAKRK